MNRNIRELFNLHTLFETPESAVVQYAAATLDVLASTGVTKFHTIILSETHKKLIQQAQKQNILHKDFGSVRAVRLAESVYYFDVQLRTIDGGQFSRGTSLHLDEAIARAFGEMYERVSMRFVPPDEVLEIKSYKQLKKEQTPVLNIFDLASATQRQKDHFPDMVWDENSIFRWATTDNLFTGEPTLVPAQLLYWNYHLMQGEPYLGEINTNGLGAGYTAEEATASAAGELVQRHSFFSFWYSHTVPPIISVESVLKSTQIESTTKKLVAAVLEYGFTVYLLNCTIVGSTPSVAVVLTKKGLGWFVGMSTNVVYEKAIERGLCEALSTYTWTMDSIRHDDVLIFQKYHFAEGFCDTTLSDRVRVLGWSHLNIAQHGSFFLTGTEQSFDALDTKKSPTAAGMLSSITNGQVFIKQASQTYLDEVQFHSVRLIAPKLFKLPLRERYSTPVLHGKEPKNTFPHPFP